MKRAICPAILAALLVLNCARSPVRAQEAGIAVNYPAGNVLVSGPPGTNFSAVDGSLNTLQTGDNGYEMVAPSSGTASGVGYWAIFDAPATVQLGAGSDQPYTTPVLAGQWILIGDPSGALPAAVTGAGAVYTYDPAQGYQQASLIQPGQGAWAQGSGNGSITVAPRSAAAVAAAANLHTVTGKGFQLGVPADWDPISLGSDLQLTTGAWGSADDEEAIMVLGLGALPAGTPINAVRSLNAALADPALAQGLGNLQASSPATQITIRGADTAAEASLTGTDPQRGPFTLSLVAAVGNNNLYLLLAFSPQNPSDQDQALVQQMIQSFQLTP